MMKHNLLATSVAALALAAAGAASAGVYSDDLGKCMVRSTSEADKTLLIRWVFAALSADPSVKSMATVTPQERSALTRGFAALIERILEKDCRPEAVAALKYEGAGVVETSFAILGEVAMRGLTNGPAFQNIGKEIGEDLDKDKAAALFKEAGVGTSAAAEK